MGNERFQLQNLYTENVHAAHEAFRVRDLPVLAKLFLKQGEIATEMYKINGGDNWDLRIYGSYNAAGGVLESIGDFQNASIAYGLALDSCKRIAADRSKEWQKNIDHLEFLVKRVDGYLI